MEKILTCIGDGPNSDPLQQDRTNETCSRQREPTQTCCPRF